MSSFENDNVHTGENELMTLNGMYQEYFLDYASYVILERAVPHIDDGFKPVQRRLLHAMKEMDDGRFHKVANIIGQTMQYHPHGDASIGDALVNMGQKDLLIDCQGNWGDIRTGDSAAAPRYIEARLTKFALEVIFNPQTTEWQATYDGRKKEPITLPVKFPMVLAQGVEGIAVGLSTKIMPHNFIELIKGSIDILKGKKPVLYPDFQTGGIMDVTEYNDGLRGGRIKVRAKINLIDKNTLTITEIPFGVTTGGLIESILKATEKGQIKIKKVMDNTAKDVEIMLELVPGTSPDLTIDALYAFTDCEVSISPNACVIIDNKPRFMTVSDILDICTKRTMELLRMELEIKKRELEEKWHMASLEKIFIEKRIYRDIEESENWEAAMKAIELGLRKYVGTPSDPAKSGDGRLMLVREITEEDLTKLAEIRIKRISKYNTFKHEEHIKQLEDDLRQVLHDLAHLVDFTIEYFKRLLEKYGKGRERKTVISSLETIQVQQVVANNAKLYANFKDGFIGIGMKKDEFVCDCSDIDDIIAFTKDGTFKVVRVADKTFVGKDLIHVAVWKKNDERTTYNLVYLDGKTGVSYAKRFNVTAITRDKDYDLTKDGSKGSKVLYFSAQPNGESEILGVQLSPGCSAKKKVFDFDFSEIAIKGRGSQGNILTKYPVRKITQTEVGKSSLGALQIYIDEVTGRLNNDGRGRLIGAFDTGSRLIIVYKDGSYELNEMDITKKYDVNAIEVIQKWKPDSVVSAVYFEGEKGWTMVKRFKIETSSIDQKFSFITEAITSKLYHASVDEEVMLHYTYKNGNEKVDNEVHLNSFIDVKGWKAAGNKLIEGKLLKSEAKKIAAEGPELETPTAPITLVQTDLFGQVESEEETKTDKDKTKFKPGDTIELD